MQKDEDFTKQFAEYVADLRFEEHSNELDQKRTTISLWRGLFIEQVIKHERLIEIFNAVYFVGRDWGKILEFKNLIYPPETPFSYKSNVFFYIIKKELPIFYNSLDKDFRVGFLSQISGIRNKFAHYPFVFIGQEEKSSIKIQHSSIKESKVIEKSLQLTQEEFDILMGKMWLSNDFVKQALIKLTFNKKDDKYIIKKEEQQKLPDFIKFIATNNLTI